MDIIDIYLKSQTHKTLSSDILSGMLSHAYLLECSDAVILQEYVYLMAKEICCMSDVRPCNQCLNCQKIDHSNMVDLIIYPRGEKSIVVDDVNEIVVDSFVRPIENQYKIYILNNFDLATTQAQNKILKTLEEPPANVVFILTCSNSNLVLPTIISRTKRISEPLVDIAVVDDYLTSRKIADSSTIASISGGNISIALKLSKGGEAKKIVDLALDTLLNLKSSGDILKFSSRIVALKKDIPFFVDTMVSLLRDSAVIKSGEAIQFKDYSKYVSTIAQMYSVSAVYQIVGKLMEIHNKLEFNCNANGVIDKMLLDILEVRFLCN